MDEPTKAIGSDPTLRGRRLDSWKEIAAYLKRDIRTAQRWEKLESLPVHRHQHDERGTAFAYSGEIDRWLEARTRTATDERVAPLTADAASSRRLPRVVLLAAVLAALAAAATAAAIWAQRSAPPKLTTLSVVFPIAEQFPDWGPEISVSPDGAAIAYAGRGPIKLRRLDELAGRTIAMGGAPFFSPDGSSIGFFAPGRIFRVAAGGGTPVEVARIEAEFYGAADWGPQGEIVYATTTPDGSHALVRVPAGGGRPSTIATLEAQTEPAYWLTPQWIDDGKHLLCTVARSLPSGIRFEAGLVSVSTGAWRSLLDDARHARLFDDILVYWRQNGLFAVRFDRDRLQPHGPHVPAWEGVGSRVRNRSWSAAGDTLVYWPSVRSPGRLVTIDRDGREESLAIPEGHYQSPRLSPDGRHLAVIDQQGSSEFADLWRHDLATGASVRLTDQRRSSVAQWAPDGASLIVAMGYGASNDLYRVRADGTGTPQRVTSPDFLAGALKQPVGWASDGTLIVLQTNLTTEQRYWALSPDGTTAPRSILHDPTAGPGSVSPDGKWLAYSSRQSGRTEVHVVRLPEGHPAWQVSRDGGSLPVWAKNGRELFFRSGATSRSMMAVAIEVAAGALVPVEPRRLFDKDFYMVDPGEPHYTVAPDGRFFVALRGRPDGPERLNVVQGWRSEVERRLRAAR